MDSRAELTPKDLEEYFKLELRNADPDVRDRYYTLLSAEQVKRAKERKVKTQESIPLELKEDFLRIAKVTPNIEAARRALKMERDWEKASSEGRPPIGGAVDD